MNEDELKKILEAVIYAADEPMSLSRLMSLFSEDDNPGREAIKTALEQLQEETADRSIELKEVGSGYRYQVRQNYAEWVSKLWQERPARYSRASLETLALMAYRQPVTRAEIEEVRGVSVSSNIIKAFIERDWVKVVGHRDVPGKPALYATTKGFLDYFNLASLEDLPSLAEIRDIDSINEKLELSLPGENSEMIVDEEIPDSTDVKVSDETASEIESGESDELAEPVNG
ncbi:MAG: SMC-Scp complex subunit ScpB [Gammaproteobacteria bacterium]|nr:SMC-Scp complex subunit ScpB [Gammaproteobacteria bacterium]